MCGPGQVSDNTFWLSRLFGLDIAVVDTDILHYYLSLIAVDFHKA